MGSASPACMSAKQLHHPNQKGIDTMGITTRGIGTALAIAAGATLLVPGGAFAKSQTFGSSLVNEPANTGNQRVCAPTPGQPCTRVGFYVGNAGLTKSPVDGTITKFRVRSAAPGQ